MCTTARRPGMLLLLWSREVESWVDYFSGISHCNNLFLLMGLPFCSTSLSKGCMILCLKDRNWNMGLLPCSYMGNVQLKPYFSSGLLKPFSHEHLWQPKHELVDPTLTPCSFSPKRGDHQLHLKKKKMRKNSYKFLEWLHACAKSTYLTV